MLLSIINFIVFHQLPTECEASIDDHHGVWSGRIKVETVADEMLDVDRLIEKLVRDLSLGGDA